MDVSLGEIAAFASSIGVAAALAARAVGHGRLLQRVDVLERDLPGRLGREVYLAENQELRRRIDELARRIDAAEAQAVSVHALKERIAGLEERSDRLEDREREIDRRVSTHSANIAIQKEERR